MMEIEFLEKEHKYIDEEGNAIPSVTDILTMVSGYDKVNPAVLEHAAMKGTLVHEWCEQYDYGCPDEQVPSLYTFAISITPPELVLCNCIT